MENANYSSSSNLFNDQQISLPNANAVLILGIVSILGCCCWGVPGLICGIISLVLSKKDLQLYASMPGNYTPSSYNNLKAGRICAIIGIILSALYLLFTVVLLTRFGMEALSNPELMKQMMKH